eukprot:TRINITY_DN1142_c0_g1_i1.p1 TRINITY_DN1142_c0_g1~~TRINITY_DN1142_c0_g1_i1.p1  ORF type:complete len:142 (+),score=26.07 TRINITY_DN1142_c0_g1_i1:372-797(+)
MPVEIIPALNGHKIAYSLYPNSDGAFASENVIDPTGKHMLGSYSPLQPDVPRTTSYESFMDFFARCLEKWNQIRAMEQKFKNGSFFGGLADIAKLTKSGFADLKNGLSAANEVWQQTKTAGVGEDVWTEMAHHGLLSQKRK